ncbi:hypothetical protein C7212DRAFT_365980 [Tuber magnatum]|uniref:Uncharacterized protein n=1 Tax=Tuber magnatum TaxID=42249 RepID=A0A317SKJ0_9PEZI|nr:hypothetical protein C7212DRAFT_365980 [Tuber magnatum]
MVGKEALKSCRESVAQDFTGLGNCAPVANTCENPTVHLQGYRSSLPDRARVSSDALLRPSAGKTDSTTQRRYTHIVIVQLTWLLYFLFPFPIYHTIPFNNLISSPMKESESIFDLATSVSQGFERAKTFAKSHQGLRIARLLSHRMQSIGVAFQTAFGPLPESTSVDGGNFWPAIYEGDRIPGEPLPEHVAKDKLGRYYYRLRWSLQDVKGLTSLSNPHYSQLRDQTAPIAPGHRMPQQETENKTENQSSGNSESTQTPQISEFKQLLNELQDFVNEAIDYQKLAQDIIAPGHGDQCDGNSWISLLFGIFTALVAMLNTRSPSASAPPLPSQTPKSKTNRIALTDLYNVLSRELRCQCHIVHLGLCSAFVDPSESGSSPNELGNPGSICSLFITRDLSAPKARYVSEDLLYLKASRHRSSDRSTLPPGFTLPSSPTGDSTYCSRIITSPVSSKYCLQCEAPARTEFLIESAHNTCGSILTLHDILTSHSQNGGTVKPGVEDRHLLATKLVRSVLRRYDTPWLRDLNTQKICFFTRYEDNPNHANWTPYISASFGRAPLACGKSNELYALGLVLLELGLDGRPGYFLGNDRARTTEIALRDLPRTLGRRYKIIVKKLLAEGEKADRMGRGQIDDLESEIISIIEWNLGILSGNDTVGLSPCAKHLSFGGHLGL